MWDDRRWYPKLDKTKSSKPGVYPASYIRYRILSTMWELQIK